ncbi:MAG: NERD domain-containing protein [Sphingobacteriales bacterium]|nr:MAG: NERD domain-containing protein [Sphingobacteriales bacterium]
MLFFLLIIGLLMLLVIPVAIYKSYKSRIKGAIGEETVAFRLARLPKSEYKVINNLVLSSDSRTSQIDHLIISDYGLFVIETKNIKGWIFGRESSEYWTQVIYNHKESFYNPVRQNRGHISALKAALNGFLGINFIPIVAFASKATLKVETSSDVVYTYELLRTVKSYKDRTLSDDQKDRVFERLTSLNVSHTYDRRAHINSIRRRVEARDRLVEQDICPQCGGDLLLRSGTYGDFLGCSRFPLCKFNCNTD